MASTRRPTVTISSDYGCSGIAVATGVARRLGVELFDHLIPATVAADLSVALAQAEACDDRAESRWGQLLRGLSFLASPAEATQHGMLPTPRQYKQHTERVLRELAGGGGVILGRAGMIVLRDEPGVFKVALRGPVDRRVRRAMAERGLQEARARAELAATDRARQAYVRYFYRERRNNPELFHLMVDATALPVPAVVELVAAGATAFGTGPG